LLAKQGTGFERRTISNDRAAPQSARPGILAGSPGPHDNILKLRPPIVFSREPADFFLDVLDDVLGTTE